MDEFFVPSLERSSCEKIVMFLLDDSDLRWLSADDYKAVKSKVMAKISKLTPCKLLQRKLEALIAPLLFDLKNWTRVLEKDWKGVNGYFYVTDVIPKCRLPDGTVDKEKCILTLITDNAINPLDRFIMACVFCMFEYVPELWNGLERIEKAYLRNESSKTSESQSTKNLMAILRHWIEWLESNRERDWQSFAAWTLESPVWSINVFILKRMLPSISPSEKGQRLLKAVTEHPVSSDMMWFCLSMMTEDEREEVYRKSPSEVFRCILSWPLRHLFYVFAKKLWPYVTERTFFSIMRMLLWIIPAEDVELSEVIEMMKTIWARGPDHYKKFVQEDGEMCRKIDFVLKHDLSKPFDWTGFYGNRVNHSRKLISFAVI